MIARALQRVTAGELLSRSEMRELIAAIMEGKESDLAVAALLAALRTRGETPAEIAGAAEAMRALAVPLPEAPPDAIDTCGTGGDGADTFNISTLAALVVAGAGVPVAKHGNRAATSRCGSAELLEALDVRLEIEPALMARAVSEVGIGFLFARLCHPAMARVAPIRSALPIPTLFNRLGPLTNPMRPRHQLLGVARAADAEPALDALVELGIERAWVVHGEDGLDEISSAAPTRVYAFNDGKRRSFTLEPGAYVPRATAADLRGGDVDVNASIARSVLDGAPGAPRNVVVLNAGAALCIVGRATELAEGVRAAAAAIDSGAARDTLARFVTFTREAELAS